MDSFPCVKVDHCQQAAPRRRQTAASMLSAAAIRQLKLQISGAVPPSPIDCGWTSGCIGPLGLLVAPSRLSRPANRSQTRVVDWVDWKLKTLDLRPL